MTQTGAYTILYTVLDASSYSAHNRFDTQTAETEPEAREIAAAASRQHGHATIHHARAMIGSYVNGDPFTNAPAA